MPEVRKKCPHCDAAIDHLNYCADMTERGSCDLHGNDWNCDDNEVNETNYHCPECDWGVNTEDLIAIDEESSKNEEEETPTLAEQASVAEMDQPLLVSNSRKSSGSRDIAVFTCPDCGYQGLAERCPECEHVCICSLI